MPKQYMTRYYTDKGSGQRRMQREINQMARSGWVVVSSQISTQGFAPSKTCCLGCIFLPLALLGKKANNIQVMFERDVS